jgi:excisionase family DNA binding protein
MTESVDNHVMRWLTVREVAERLAISSRGVYDRIDDGRLRAHNFSGEVHRAMWRINPRQRRVGFSGRPGSSSTPASSQGAPTPPAVLMLI